MKNLFRRIKRDKLSVRDTEKLVKKLRSSKTIGVLKKRPIKNKYTIHYENSLVRYLGAKVDISMHKNKKMIKIHFSNDSDLERIIDLILNEE